MLEELSRLLYLLSCAAPLSLAPHQLLLLPLRVAHSLLTPHLAILVSEFAHSL